MTEDEAREVVERVNRQAWALGVGALITNLGLIAFNILWGSKWWLPLNVAGLAVAAWGIRHLVNNPVPR